MKRHSIICINCSGTIENMTGILPFLKTKLGQCLINGVIALALALVFYLSMEYVYYSSNGRVHYKQYVLILGILLYTLQAIYSLRILNFITQVILMVLAIYTLYSYAYAFFDQEDLVMKKSYGILSKTWWTIVKLSCLLIAMWITYLIQPKLKIDNTNSR